MPEPAYAMNQPNFAELYERFLVQPLFRPWAELLIDRASLTSGDRVLDVACGTGIVARMAKQRLGSTGRVVAVDLSPLMLGVARTVGPGIEWREGNATSLPLEANEAFDLVLCQQGLQFFQDRPAAVREMRRALVPGGRLAVATWTSLDDNPPMFETHRIAERHVGPIVDQRHAFGDGTALRALLTDAGFANIEVSVETLPLHFDDAATFARMNAMALVGMSAGSKQLSDEEKGRLAGQIGAESTEALRRFADTAGITFPLRSNVATARR